MLLVDDDCVQSNLVPCTASLSGARDASLMDGVSGTMAQLGRWPVWPHVAGRECIAPSWSNSPYARLLTRDFVMFTKLFA